MATLDFHRPFHFDDIDNNGQIKTDRNPNNSPAPDKPGIYIWGFMYYYNYDGLTEPVDFKKDDIRFDENKMKFIPYYVGKAEKRKSDNGAIFKRILQHHNVRNIRLSNSNKWKYPGTDADKYIRFSHDYMKDFFIDKNNFPVCNTIKTKTYYHPQILNFIKNFPSKIIYFNLDNALISIYPGINPILVTSGKKKIKTNWPITKQSYNNKPISDTLENLVECMNNFWFCYAIEDKDLNISIKELETYTFWSLKGLTVSQTGCCPLPNVSITIIDNTNTNIFKKDKMTNQIIPSNQFNGY